jgi:glycosyltransferase involved in cell wall biosynthesis
MEQLFFPYRKLRMGKIDILHVPYLNIPVFYRGKLAVTIHDLTPLTFPQFLPTRLHYFYCKFMIWLACRKASVIFTDSENTKRDIMRFFNVAPNKISVTHLAAGEEFILREKSDVLYLKKKYNIPADKKVILYVGNLLPHKNLNTLLKAFKLLKSNDSCNLVIAGKIFEKRLRPDLSEQSVIYTGFVSQEELVDFYNLADLFVFPSLYEGFGLPVLEAFACGTPVACSRTSSLPETGGEAAFYFDPSDENDMAVQMEKALASKQTPEELRDYALRFSWKKTAEQTLNALHSVIA